MKRFHNRVNMRYLQGLSHLREIGAKRVTMQPGGFEELFSELETSVRCKKIESRLEVLIKLRRDWTGARERMC